MSPENVSIRNLFNVIYKSTLADYHCGIKIKRKHYKSYFIVTKVYYRKKIVVATPEFN